MFINIIFYKEYHIYRVHVYLVHILFLKQREFSPRISVSIHNLSSASEKTSQRGKGIFHIWFNADQMTLLFLNDCQ